MNKINLEIEILNNSGKINLGYYSTDFRDHPIGHLISKMLETHDKSKFEIFPPASVTKMIPAAISHRFKLF